MGKTSKSITALSAKQKLKANKTASLQKTQSKSIKKVSKETRKSDLEELRSLLKLEADAPVEKLDGTGNGMEGDGMVLDGGPAMKAKFVKPGQKARRRMKLMKTNPEREKNPALFADRQVESAEAMMESGQHLSRGQRKRL